MIGVVESLPFAACELADVFFDDLADRDVALVSRINYRAVARANRLLAERRYSLAFAAPFALSRCPPLRSIATRGFKRGAMFVSRSVFLSGNCPALRTRFSCIESVGTMTGEGSPTFLYYCPGADHDDGPGVFLFLRSSQLPASGNRDTDQLFD